jgi:hypothetical protein
VLVVGIHPDPVTANDVPVGPDVGFSLTVGTATVQDFDPPTPWLSLATTVYVPGFSGGTTMVTLMLPSAAIVVDDTVIGAATEPNATLVRLPPGVNPEPCRSTVVPAAALLGVIVSATAPIIGAEATASKPPTIASTTSSLTKLGNVLLI